VRRGHRAAQKRPVALVALSRFRRLFLAAGGPLDQAAEKAEVSRRTVERWRAQGRAELERASPSARLALELTILVARKDPRRHPRVAARWLLRLLEEHPDATIEEAALAASNLVALTGVGYQEAAQTLRAMAERATRRRRARGVA
jgi:hypothetical protein